MDTKQSTMVGNVIRLALIRIRVNFANGLHTYGKIRVSYVCTPFVYMRSVWQLLERLSSFHNIIPIGH